MAEKAYILRKDKILSGYDGNLEHVKVFDNAGAEKVKITNGVLVVVEGLLEGREVYKARLASLDDVGEDVVLIHNAEVMYDERLHRLTDFRIEADKVARGYHLSDRDIFTLTVDLFVAEPNVGDKLIVHTDGKLGKDDTKLADAKLVFEVIEDSGYELHQRVKAYAVKVKRK